MGGGSRGDVSASAGEQNVVQYSLARPLSISITRSQQGWRTFQYSLSETQPSSRYSFGTTPYFRVPLCRAPQIRKHNRPLWRNQHQNTLGESAIGSYLGSLVSDLASKQASPTTQPPPCVLFYRPRGDFEPHARIEIAFIPIPASSFIISRHSPSHNPPPSTIIGKFAPNVHRSLSC